MRVRFARCVSAATAVEFAFVAPCLIAMMLGIFSLAIGLWTWNTLQSTAAVTARCIALASILCANVTAGCDSATPGICYAEKIAASRGVTNVLASEINISSTPVADSTMVTVSISHSLQIAGYSFALPASGSSMTP